MHLKSPILGRVPGFRHSWFALRACVILLVAAWTLVTFAAPQKAKKPLSKDDVIGLLEGQVEPSRVADVCRSEGITFALDSATEKGLRDAGADDNLIGVLRQLAPHSKTEPATPDNLSPGPGPPILLIEATPGGAQVYIDDEPKATTSSEGRVRFSQLAPGVHDVRLSIAGYKDYEQKVELKAGQTSTVFATLATVKSASTTTSTTPANIQSGGQGTAGSNTTSVPGGQTPAINNANVLRFLVGHDHGFPAGQNFCFGWMAIGNGKVQFQGSRAIANGQAGGPTHSFDISGDEIREAKKNGVYLAQMGGFHIKLKKGTNINLVVVNTQGNFLPPDEILRAIESTMHVKLD